MTFRVGQRVVCVDAIDQLVRGEVYTVLRVGDIFGADLVAVDANNPSMAWYPWRFRPLISQADDIAMFTALVEGMKPTERLDALMELLDQ
jgi:hypothetical protein